jgi:hypothetical protein
VEQKEEGRGMRGKGNGKGEGGKEGLKEALERDGQKER